MRARYGFQLHFGGFGRGRFGGGYYGGKGVPFFGLGSIPGKADKTKEDGAFAGQMFKWHKWAGGFLWYLAPLHVAGALQHSLRGHAIWTRINPLAPR